MTASPSGVVIGVWARVAIGVCCVTLFSAAIFAVAQTETGRHILILLVTGGAKG